MVGICLDATSGEGYTRTKISMDLVSDRYVALGVLCRGRDVLNVGVNANFPHAFFKRIGCRGAATYSLEHVLYRPLSRRCQFSGSHLLQQDLLKSK